MSLRQVYECEKKLRLLSVLKLKLKNDVNICLSDFEFNWDQYETEIPSPSSPILVSVTEEDINSSRESTPVTTYIGGYCCFSISKKLKCEECKQLIVSNLGEENSFNNSLTKGINRGGHKSVNR